MTWVLLEEDNIIIVSLNLPVAKAVMSVIVQSLILNPGKRDKRCSISTSGRLARQTFRDSFVRFALVIHGNRKSNCSRWLPAHSSSPSTRRQTRPILLSCLKICLSVNMSLCWVHIEPWFTGRLVCFRRWKIGMTQGTSSSNVVNNYANIPCRNPSRFSSSSLPNSWKKKLAIRNSRSFFEDKYLSVRRSWRVCLISVDFPEPSFPAIQNRRPSLWSQSTKPGPDSSWCQSHSKLSL